MASSEPEVLKVIGRYFSDIVERPRAASRLLAAVKASAGPNDYPFRTHFEGLVYSYCTRQLRLLDQDSARSYQMEGAVRSLTEREDAA